MMHELINNDFIKLHLILEVQLNDKHQKEFENLSLLNSRGTTAVLAILIESFGGQECYE